MHKPIFFLLSNVIVCMSIVCMQPDEQTRSLISLPKEIICKIMNNTDFPSIAWFKQTNKKFSSNDPQDGYAIDKLTCYNTSDCLSPICSHLKKNYNQSSFALIYLAKDPENKKIFNHLYQFHEQQRDQELLTMEPDQSLAFKNKMEIYTGTYVDPQKISLAIEQNNIELLTRAMNNKLYYLALQYIKPVANNYKINEYYQTILDEAINRDDPKMVARLIENGTYVSPESLCKAVQHGHIGIVKLFIKEESLGNRDAYHNALLEAAEYNHIEIVKRLIKNGADVNPPDKGDTPPDLMRQNNYTFGSLINSLPFFDKNYQLIRNSVLLSGATGIIYLLYKKSIDFTLQTLFEFFHQ